MADLYRTIIGLEVHVQLATASKLFCRCRTRFGQQPNTQTCPVCIGMPGSLPVINAEAVRLSRETAIALDCTIPPFTKWDRKQYYYPDLPKGYQISQYDLPLSEHGHLHIEDPQGRFAAKEVGIIRAHLEEDAGKSVHDEAAGRGDSQIDLNRTGTPLLEIVSAPEMNSPLEARVFLDELKLLLTYLGVSDCNMQEGSLRVDANINLEIATDQRVVFTPIVEIKNMNSFRSVERALAYEAERHYQEWQQTGVTKGDSPKQTRGWDDAAGITRPLRSKEESSDYRYFPDPDLVPITTTAAEVEQIRKSLAEFPASLRRRLQEEDGLSYYDADVLVNQGRGMVDYYRRAAETGGDSKLAANWVTQDVLRILNERDQTIDSISLPAERLGGMIACLKSGELLSSRAKEVFELMVDRQIAVEDALRELGIEQVDDSEIERLCQDLVDRNPRIVADIRGGNLKAAGALIGQAKKQNPNVDPTQVREVCLRLIEARDA